MSHVAVFADIGKGSLVISVLKESPSRTLGRLIFERGLHPQKLEAMMGDFPHLRIVEVLVKCCCPLLPAQATPVPRSGQHQNRILFNLKPIFYKKLCYTEVIALGYYLM